MILFFFLICLIIFGFYALFWIWHAPPERFQLLKDVYGEQMVIDTLQRFPDSPLGKKFPHLKTLAEATNRYNELNEQLKDGLIDEIEYELQLEKILTLINFS